MIILFQIRGGIHIIFFPDKRGYPHNIFLHESIHCGYSIEGLTEELLTSTTSRQHMFLWRNKKNFIL